ncbi:MAG: hypothetical protein AB7G11_15890 [Phycisphaerales bacterium]
MKRFRLACLCACVTMAALCPVTPAGAQQRDPVAQRLAAAREVYERKMESIRERVLGAIASAKRSARKPGTVEALDAARAGFISQGTWPDVSDLPEFRRDAAKAAEAIRHAYARAMADYSRAEQDELAGAVEEDRRVFSLHADVIPWSPSLTALSPAAWKRVSTEPRTTAPDPILAGEYRIEILAVWLRSAESSSAPPATLLIDVPVSSGRVLPVRAIPDAKGDVHVILTVGEGAIAADLGVQRPVDLESARPDEPRIRVRAEGGVFEVANIRIKPLVAGAPEALIAKPETDENTRAPRPAPSSPLDDRLSAWLPLKGVWRGSRQNRDDKAILSCTVKISRPADDILVLHLDHGDHVLAFDCRLEGDRITLTGVRQTKGAKAIRRAPSGSGRVSEKYIEVNYFWFLDTADVKNQRIEGTLRVKRDGT